MKNALLGIMLILVVIFVFSIVFFNRPEEAAGQQLKKFSSYEELKSFVKNGAEQYLPYYSNTFGTRTLTDNALAAPTAAEMAPGASPSPTEYSGTNIQVEGVDEPDTVKTDGKYIYAAYGSNVTIVDAYPAETSNLISSIEVNGSVTGLFVNNDRLIVLGSESYYYVVPMLGGVEESLIYPGSYNPKSFIKIYDISDRSNPVLAREIFMNGTYFDSRMIGDYVYLIVNEPVQYSGGEIPLPIIQDGGITREIAATDIYYPNILDYSYVFTNVLAINTQDDNAEIGMKTFLTGYSQTIYVSQNNIYIVYPKTFSVYDYQDRIIDEALLPLLPLEVQNSIKDIENQDISTTEKSTQIYTVLTEYINDLNPEQSAALMRDFETRSAEVMREIAKEMEKTYIHKISISNGDIEYVASGDVPGRVLNQYSMDEYNNNFRIATTTGQFWASSPVNNVYTLDESLGVVGRLEDLAPTETIFAVRFLGDKAYMVTFRRTDPLFVIDLSDPSNPNVLGELKIPGHSDYLHPYDENHLIGVGKESDANGRDLGVKISFYDITDFSNPKESSKIVIGTTGSYTPVSDDYKAFLFSKSKNLLVVPITVAETNYETSWQGAYVFSIDLENGIVQRGRITHVGNYTGYWYNYDYNIYRSLYIDNVLYTLSNRMIKMNDLTTLDEINKITISSSEIIVPKYI